MNIMKNNQLLIGILFTIGSFIWLLSMIIPFDNITFKIDWWFNTIAAILFTIGSIYQIKISLKK